MASPKSVAQWDATVDVLICGFGCAGLSAAIEAHDLDASADVLAIEKAPEEFEGGNCRVSGQSMLISKNKEALKDYQRKMSAANPMSEEWLEFWGDSMVNLEPWIQQIAKDAGQEFLRGTGFTSRDAVLEFPEYGARDAVAYTSTILPIPSGVWMALRANAAKRGVKVRYNSRLVDLIQDPDTLEVFGAWIEENGVRKAIRAKRGVIMATGGYENSPYMQNHYYGLSNVKPFGTPYNEGDGIRILQKAGAELWHMRNQGQSGGIWPGVQLEDLPTCFMRNFFLPAYSWFDIDNTGRRFYNEANELQLTHYKEKKHGRYVDVPLHLAYPMYMIMDEASLKAGKMVIEVMTWAAVVSKRPWSEDNSEEVAAGIIKKADNIADLAAQINIDPAVLEDEVAKYNAACATGVDNEHGRAAETLQPIANGPFYALPMTPAIVCTGGGGKRDTQSRVLAHDGTPIPHLFEAGELGSIFSDLYQNGSYLTEAMITGRMAARSALAQSPSLLPDEAA